MAEPMTASQMLPLLQSWKDRHAELSAQMDALSVPLGGTFDGPLFNAVWMTWDAYTDQLAHRLGDEHDWLQWFVSENDMGRKGMEVHSLTRSLKVRTLRQLASLIAGSRA
jgi:hypothetical protein